MSAALDPIRVRVRMSTGGTVALAIVLLVLAAAGGAVGMLVVTGALDGHWYDFRDLGIGVAHLRAWLDEQTLGLAATRHRHQQHCNALAARTAGPA